MRAPSAVRASPSARAPSRRQTAGSGRRNWAAERSSHIATTARAGALSWRGSGRAVGARYDGVHRTARVSQGCGHPPPVAHPIRTPGGRGDGQRAAGAGTAAGIGLRVARYANPTPPNFGHPEVIAPRTCATGVQAARRRSRRRVTELAAGIARDPEASTRRNRATGVTWQKRFQGRHRNPDYSASAVLHRAGLMAELQERQNETSSYCGGSGGGSNTPGMSLNWSSYRISVISLSYST